MSRRGTSAESEGHWRAIRIGALFLLGAVAIAALWSLAYQHTYAEPPNSGVSYTPPPPAPEPPSALWIGDSYTLGAGAENQDTQSYVAVACAEVNWNCHIDAQGGSGFTGGGEAGQPVERRVKADAREYNPDIVVVDAGRNDHVLQLDQITPAAAAALDKVRAAFPNAELILVAPFYVSSNDDPMPEGYAEFLRRQADRLDAILIDPAREGGRNSPPRTATRMGSTRTPRDTPSTGASLLAASSRPA